MAIEFDIKKSDKIEVEYSNNVSTAIVCRKD